MSELPAELSRRIWFLTLPDPRIVYVQRRLTSGQDAEEEWYSSTGEDPPSDTYFMSPSSSNQIITLLQTCRESRSVAKETYTLLFPESSTWFSFSSDFLHLDFGRSSPHTMQYEPRDFTVSIPDPPSIANEPRLSRYLRPRFDLELARKVKNLVITMSSKSALDELMAAFTRVEVLVIADQLYNSCYEDGEELVWLKGQLGDEMSSLTGPDEDGRSLAQLGLNPRNRASRQELKTEKQHMRMLGHLILWESLSYRALDDDEKDDLLEEWESQTTKKLPIIIRKSITTAKSKTKLLAICGSEDNFTALLDLDWKFVEGKTYNSSLSLYQQLGYAELILERVTADIVNNCKLGCSNPERELPLKEHLPLLIYWRDRLVREIRRLQDANETA